MYKTVMIDPPWKKSTGGVGHKTLQCSTHYDVQSKEEIIATLKRWFEEYGVAPEAHLYMWAINSSTAGKDQGIIPAIDVVERVGFTPITLTPCVKRNVGSQQPDGLR